ncbi:AraC family transcriptional regulator [Reyranella sp.]|jgi:AraC-like DNA-binding protein|uniref:helix-turn-helix transcriptional regulator n=1 Tax=Reyranella sp. TaxID=1929291 RepID=UPI002F94D250
MARRDCRNSTRYWWDRHLPGLSLLCADFTTHEYPPHTHDALVVAVTEQGGSVIRSRGQVEDAHPSTLFVFNPAEPHAGWMGWSKRWQYRSMYLTHAALDQVAKDLGIESVPYFTRNLFGDPDLIEGFLAMHRAIEQGRDVFYERELLIGSFGKLFRRHGSGRDRIKAAPRDRVLFDRAAERMRAEYGTELRLEDLAQQIGLTTFQLIGLFKRTVGLTPHAYLTQIRLGMACRHLRRSSALAEVATAVGFYDQSALNKHFKRCYGITPLQFARAAMA